MTLQEAVKIAVEAIDYKAQRLAPEAQMFLRFGLEHGRRSAGLYNKLKDARKHLLEHVAEAA